MIVFRCIVIFGRFTLVPFNQIVYDEFLKQGIYESSQRKGIFVKTRHLYQIVIKSRGQFYKRILTEPIQNQFCAVDFERNHKFYENFSHKIQQLFEAGITDMYKKKHERFYNSKYYEKPQLTHKKYLETTWRKSFNDEPKVLTMKDLEFGFVIWLLSLILPVVAFIFEWLIKVRHFLIINFLLKAYFAHKYSESSENTKKQFRDQIIIYLQSKAAENSEPESESDEHLAEIKTLKDSQTAFKIDADDFFADWKAPDDDDGMKNYIFADLEECWKQFK
jgi:hypothetical protein